jgi:hypothetical protein
MRTIDRVAILNPADGLMVFDMNTLSFWVYRGIEDGGWNEISQTSNGLWSKNGSKIYNTNLTGVVGIGTSSPSLGKLLTLNSNSLSLWSGISFAYNDLQCAELSAVGNINNSNKDIRLSTAPGNNGRISFSAGGTQLKLNPEGTVTIGSSGMVGPYTLLISDDEKDPMIQFQKGATDKGFLQIVNDDIKVGTNVSNENGNFFIRVNGADRLKVDKNGYVGVGTVNPQYRLQVGSVGDGSQARANAWNTFSDERFKINIVPIKSALSKIEKLHGYYYNWNTGTDSSRQAGLLAQEVESVLPEIVSTDAEGYKSVDYGKMNALLLQAIKEQQLLINALLEKGK